MSGFVGDGNAPYEEDYGNQMHYDDHGVNKNSAESDTPMTEDEEAYDTQHKRNFDSVANMLEDTASKFIKKDGFLNVSGIQEEDNYTDIELERVLECDDIG
jgi:hypothetical protein